MAETPPADGTGPQTISVIIPVYCNAESLGELDSELSRIEPALAGLGLKLQVIFVDDGSTDDSLPRLLAIRRGRANALVVKHSRNFGATAALKTGYRYVEGDCFMFIAADLQDPVDRIVELARHWKAGSKFTALVRRSRDDPAASRAFSWFFYRLVRTFVFRDFPTSGFDVALLDRQLLPYLQNSAKNINPSLFAHYLGFEAKLLPYDRAPRRHGRSRWTFGKKVRYFLDSILGFSIAPIRMVTAIGMLVALCSFAYGLVILTTAIVYGSPFPGFPTLAVLISLLSGINLMVSGIIGEYVWRVFDEVNKRPESVVDEVF